MSGLYFEAHPSMSASRLTSEVALALQNKREAYVYCHPSDGDAVERLLKRPFVAQPDLSELISQQAKPQGETERIHTLIKPDPELLLYLLNTGVWDTRGLPKEKQPNGTFGARRRAPYEPPCHVTPEVIQQTWLEVRKLRQRCRLDFKFRRHGFHHGGADVAFADLCGVGGALLQDFDLSFETLLVGLHPSRC